MEIDVELEAAVQWNELIEDECRYESIESKGLHVSTSSSWPNTIALRRGLHH